MRYSADSSQLGSWLARRLYILTMHTSYNGDMQTLSVGFTISPQDEHQYTKGQISLDLFIMFLTYIKDL